MAAPFGRRRMDICTKVKGQGLRRGPAAKEKGRPRGLPLILLPVLRQA